jgi:integrase
MSVQKLGPGRYRAQVYQDGKNVSVGKILGADTERFGAAPGSSVFPSEAKARDARALARERLRTAVTRGPTVAEWAERWWNDPLFHTWKRGHVGESTLLWRRQVTQAFVGVYGSALLRDVDDDDVAEWLAGGKRNYTVPGLHKMFADAASKKAGRLISENPWHGLELPEARGNKDKDPPKEEQVWAMVRYARRRTSPSFAAWLQFAAFTGMRPGEIDALRWDRIDFDRSRIAVVEQWSPKLGKFKLPKGEKKREAILTPPAREAVLGLARESEFVFTTLRGSHFTPSARSSSWNKVREGTGWVESLYLATRHFAGWYMWNVLELDADDVATALGHVDAELIRSTYGHRDRDRALARAQAAYESVGNVTPLRVVKDEGA